MLENKKWMILVLLLAAPVFAVAQAAQPPIAPNHPAVQDNSYTAEQLVQMLTDDPVLLDELKQKIADQAWTQGQFIDPKSLDNDRVFSLVRSDPKVRELLNSTLKTRRNGLDDERSSLSNDEYRENEDQVSAREWQSSDETPTRTREDNLTSEDRQLGPDRTDREKNFSKDPRLSRDEDWTKATNNDRTSRERLGTARDTTAASGDTRSSRKSSSTMTRSSELNQESGRSGDLKSRRPAMTDRSSRDNTTPQPPLPKSRPNPYRDLPALNPLYAQVTGTTSNLRRFGTDIFENGTGNLDDLPMDLPVGPDYVLGPGDDLNINIYGAMSARLDRVVDRSGQVSLPEVGTVQVTGMTLDQAQHAFSEVLGQRYRHVQNSVSLAKVRSIRVYVVGDVERPGAYDVSALSTPLNVLYAAGGPTERGSLRLVKHYRGKQLVQEADLYDLLLHGVRSDLQRMQSGDTLLVPPAGPQVTVEGMVRRPAIYELRGETSLAELLGVAGGVLPTGTLRHIEVQRIEAHAQHTMLSLDLDEKEDGTSAALQTFNVQDADEVQISPIAPYGTQAVFLTGHVLRPGKYSYHPGMKLSDLIRSRDQVLPEPSEYAEIVRLQAPNYRPAVLTIHPALLGTKGGEDPDLMPLDTVRIYSRYDFEDLPAVFVSGEVRKPGRHAIDGDMQVSDAIQQAGGLTPDALRGQAQIYRLLADSTTVVLGFDVAAALAGDPNSNLALQPRDRIVIHANSAKTEPSWVRVEGEVQTPGQYPLGRGMRVSDLINMAGGFTRAAFSQTGDLARYETKDGNRVFGTHTTIALSKALAGDPNSNLELRHGDVLSVRQVTGWNEIGAFVTVNGLVQHPGSFGIQLNERLSSVLERAGGLRENANVRGIVLERREVREQAKTARENMITQLEMQQAAPSSTDVNGNGQAQAELVDRMRQQRNDIVNMLKTAPVSGRMVVTVGKDISKWEGTSADVELRAGDVITIPDTKNWVLVSGDVYNSVSIGFIPGKNGEWYLNKAGGPRSSANKKEIFVLRADGSVVSRGKGALKTRLAPGDSVVVPQKIVGGNSAWKYVLQGAQAAGSLAVAAGLATSL